MDGSYIDQKGRVRWHCNDALAKKLKQLHDYLVIGGYDESHAARYPRLAHLISRYPESVEGLNEQERLESIPGVSSIIATIIREMIETGTCTKMERGDEFFTPPPKSVLELTAVRRLGAKTAKMLYQDYGIASFEALREAAENGSLREIKGIGKSMVDTILNHDISAK